MSPASTFYLAASVAGGGKLAYVGSDASQRGSMFLGGSALFGWF